MEQSNKARLRLNFKLLVDNIIVDEICDELFSLGIIDDEELEKITSHTFQITCKERVRVLVRTLMKNSDSNVLTVFCQVLRQSEVTRYLADAIETCDVTSASDVDEVDARNTDEGKREEFIKTIAQQSDMLLMVMRSNEEYQRTIADLSEQNRLLAEREAQFMILKSKGFSDKILLEFAELFVVLPKSDTGVTVGEATRRFSNGGRNGAGDADYMTILNRLSASSLPEDSIIACQLSIDLVQYIVANNAGRKPRQPFGCHATLLRRMVKDTFSGRHAEVLGGLKKLDISEIDGFKTFETVADEMFADGKCNWGRVVAWFAFCGYVAPNDCSDEALELLGIFAWFFLDRRLSQHPQWLQQVGGWRGLLDFLDFQKPRLLTQIIKSLPSALWTYFPSHP